MTILLTKAVRAGGVILASGSTQTLDAAVEGQLVHNGSATYVSDPATALNDVPVTASKTLPGGIELWAAGTQITASGGGISPDATGTLVGRSAHNAEAVGFVYLATDQVPAEYYFREGAAGNWSAAVTVRGPTGATGATGSQGIQGASGTNGTNGADGITFVAGTTVPNNGDGRPNGTVYVRYTG